MDKIREEFEKIVEGIDDEATAYLLRRKENGNYCDFEIRVKYEYYIKGYKSRDEEINELVKQKAIMRNIITLRDEEIKKHNKKYEKLLPDYNLKKAEIFLLKEEIKKFKNKIIAYTSRINESRRYEFKQEQKIKKLRDALEKILKKWISIEDRMPTRSECGKKFLCVIQGANDQWVEITSLYDPLESEFEAESEDEKPYFLINRITHGAVVASSSKVTHWLPMLDLPEEIRKTSLFEDLGFALNPIKTLKETE